MTAESAVAKVQEALAAAMEHDGDKACALLKEIALDSDTDRMFGVCRVIATAGCKATAKMLGDRAPDIAAGDYYALELAPEALDDPARVFSARFIAAIANEEPATAAAYYEVLLAGGPQAFIDGVVQLLADVAGQCRALLDQMEAGSG
ncbi:hypothetical protein [Streptomyces sp. NPDC047070]|uniref:hypothetical protein n=1 Tax=Streptomyces sp. NPDC047070 TaxID=3154923 RepID=UPI00345603E0